MTQPWWLWILVVLLGSSTRSFSATVESLTLDGVLYHQVELSPGQIRLVWHDEQGGPLKTFASAAAYLERRGEMVVGMTNGGIYEPGEIPSGLMIQEGRTLSAINRREGQGNFYLKPNGIFLIDDQGAKIVAEPDYRDAPDSIHYAIQSGPLLLHQGRIHPAFREASTSRLLRSGVGVTSDGRVIILIAQAESPVMPNFHQFASAFQTLGCQDALFLDGVISELMTRAEVHRSSKAFASFLCWVAPAPAKKE